VVTNNIPCICDTFERVYVCTIERETHKDRYRGRERKQFNQTVRST